MTVRAVEVKNLISGCNVEDKIVESIIEDATTLVTELLDGCTVMSTAEKNAVIKWTAAHFVASGPHRETKREKLGEAEVEYETQKGTGFESTSYGRMALSLDRCGKLQLAAKRSVKIRAVTSFE